MKTKLILTLSLLALWSCEEDLDEQVRFVKVYGQELESSGERIRELSNGDLLIAGSTALPSFEGREGDSQFDQIDISALRSPSITRTDPFGNVLLTRTFPIESILTNLGTHDVELGGTMLDVIPLSTGDFMALGQVEDVIIEGFPVIFLWAFYMILDPEFNILEFGITGEQSDPNFIFGFPKSLHPFPDGNVGILHEASCPLFDCFITGPLKFTLLKMTPLGDTLWIKRFAELAPPPLRDEAQDLTFDSNGDILVVGSREANFFDNCENLNDEQFMTVMRIDQDGNQLDHKFFGEFCEFNRGHFIFPLNPGFAVVKRFFS